MTRPIRLGGIAIALMALIDPLRMAAVAVLVGLIMCSAVGLLVHGARPRGGRRLSLRLDYERDSDPGIDVDPQRMAGALAALRGLVTAWRASDTPHVIRATAPPRAITRATPPVIDAPRRRAITREDDTTW